MSSKPMINTFVRLLAAAVLLLSFINPGLALADGDPPSSGTEADPTESGGGGDPPPADTGSDSGDAAPTGSDGDGGGGEAAPAGVGDGGGEAAPVSSGDGGSEAVPTGSSDDTSDADAASAVGDDDADGEAAPAGGGEAAPTDGGNDGGEAVPSATGGDGGDGGTAPANNDDSASGGEAAPTDESTDSTETTPTESASDSTEAASADGGDAENGEAALAAVSSASTEAAQAAESAPDSTEVAPAESVSDSTEAAPPDEGVPGSTAAASAESDDGGDEAAPADASAPASTDQNADSSQAAATGESAPDSTETIAADDPSAQSVQSADSLIPLLPDDVGLLVVDEEGEALPLATQEAAAILAVPDPQFCPAGEVFGGPTCGAVRATIGQAVNDAKLAGVAGTIYVEGGATYNENVEIWLFTNALTLLGGVGGGISTINGSLMVQTNTANVTVSSFTVTSGIAGVGNSATVTISEVTVTGNAGTLGAGSAGIAFTGSPSVTLTNVTANNIPTWGGFGYGASILNSGASSGTTVTVTNSTFNNNPNGGLLIGNVNSDVDLTNVTASNNTGDGATVNVNGNVSVDPSTFNNNTGDGLDITANAITLDQVTAKDNGANGANLDTSGSNGAINVSNSTFTGNTTNDIQADSGTNTLTLNCTTATNVNQIGGTQTTVDCPTTPTPVSSGSSDGDSSADSGDDSGSSTPGVVNVSLPATDGSTTPSASSGTDAEAATQVQAAFNVGQGTTRQVGKLAGSEIAAAMAEYIKSLLALDVILEERDLIDVMGMLEGLLASEGFWSDDPIGFDDPGGIMSNDPIGFGEAGGGLKGLLEGVFGRVLSVGGRSGNGSGSGGSTISGGELSNLLTEMGQGKYKSDGENIPTTSTSGTTETPPDTSDEPGWTRKVWQWVKETVGDHGDEKKHSTTAIAGVRGDCPGDFDEVGGCAEGTGGTSGGRQQVFDLPLQRASVDTGESCPDDKPNCVPAGVLHGAGGGSVGVPCADDKPGCIPEGVRTPKKGNPDDPCAKDPRLCQEGGGAVAIGQKTTMAAYGAVTNVGAAKGYSTAAFSTVYQVKTNLIGVPAAVGWP